MIIAQKLSELQEGLDNTLRHIVAFLGCPVLGQELDWMILWSPFQLRIFHGSTIIAYTQ